jgi:glycosyltransferase involved in cell wall biosynthesis
MNILIVTQYFWPENFRVNDLAESLYEIGHNVTVLTGLPNYPEGKLYPGYRWRIIKETHHNINIVRIPLILRGKATNLKLFLNYASFALFESILSPFMIKKKIDSIFIYGGSPITKAIPALVLKKILKAPVFLWVLDLWPEAVFVNNRVKSKVLFKAIQAMTRWIYKNCDWILVQSEAMIEPVIKNGGNAERIVYFPSWAECQFLNSTTDLSDQSFLDKLPKGFYITFAGNVGEGQDIETIIDVAENLKSIKSIHWLILGYGSKFNWLKENIEKRNLQENVHILGKRPLKTMPMYFSFSDVLLASLKKKNIYALTLPGKIQSYLASAKPIIAMIDGESARIIEQSKSGITVPSEDALGLAEAIKTMHKMSPEKLRRMGKNGRNYYLANFDFKQTLNKLNRLFLDTSNVAS